MWYDEYTKLNPHPQRWEKGAGQHVFGPTVTVYLEGMEPARDAFLWSYLSADLERLLKRPVQRSGVPDAAEIILRKAVPFAVDAARPPHGGYSLDCGEKQILLVSGNEEGLFHGVQTLAQLIAMEAPSGKIRTGRIADWPQYRNRWIMLDLGRAPFSLVFLKRIVRIAARLKYNGLHLHLHDNELNPVIYPDLPLGRDNQFALHLSAYAELIAYARDFHVAVIPELESWGHVGSLLSHYPHLYGATRPHSNGHSFVIGPETLELMGTLFGHWFNILPGGSKVHVGLDEGNWRVLPGANPKVYNRGNLTRLVCDVFQERARRHGKDMEMIMWVDYKKPVLPPPELRDRIILEPWLYSASPVITDLLSICGSPHTADGQSDRKSPPPSFVCGGGASVIHEFGALAATGQWAIEAQDYPNCLGMDVTLWGTNDLNRRMICVYHGAECAWNPLMARETLPDKTYSEGAWGFLGLQMKFWQSIFPDADPTAIDQERGEEVLMGAYRWGERRGSPCVPIWMPTELFRGDFYNDECAASRKTSAKSSADALPDVGG